jgi:hypothetical protein
MRVPRTKMFAGGEQEFVLTLARMKLSGDREIMGDSTGKITATGW